jgi:ubiquinone/menaquinone biosynthesis C-methylase UbiE
MTEQSGWQLSGSAPEAYKHYIVQAFMIGWTHALLEVAVIVRGTRVLDVACGTGVVTRQVAERVGKGGYVVGMDLNTGMLATARTFPPPPEAAPIEWREGNATALPFPDAAFEVVLCQQGLQFFPNKPGALQEMRRVLVPTGRLVLSVWRGLPHCPWQRAVAEALERHVSTEAAASIRAPFALGDTTELRALLMEAGFHTVHIQIESQMIRHPSLEAFVPGYLSATPVAGVITTLEEPTRAALLQKVKTILHAYVDDDGLAVPIEAHIVVAEK